MKVGNIRRANMVTILVEALWQNWRNLSSRCGTSGSFGLILFVISFIRRFLPVDVQAMMINPSHKSVHTSK